MSCSCQRKHLVKEIIKAGCYDIENGGQKFGCYVLDRAFWRTITQNWLLRSSRDFVKESIKAGCYDIENWKMEVKIGCYVLNRALWRTITQIGCYDPHRTLWKKVLRLVAMI